MRITGRVRQGTSFIDLLVSMGIIAVLFGGIYLVYFSLVTSIGNISARTAASEAIQAEIETIRNLPYDSVGTSGGIPPGVIPQSQAVTVGKYAFVLQTVVRNIDDPFDGTLGGNPNDTAPADYKLVEIQASCTSCTTFGTVGITTTVAPKNLESASQNGSLFINALDANGNPLAAAVVHVVNNVLSPTINLTDTTNASGVLQLVGVPTSTQSYQISVTKGGYSTDQTYPAGAPGNPNPLKPYATVAIQTVTSITFAIDALSTTTVISSDNRCTPVANVGFSLQGSKLIGTSPDVLKFSTTSATGAGGTATLSGLEWDTYTLSMTSTTRDLVGTMPLSPFVLAPSSTLAFRMVVQQAADPALLVAATDAATGAGIANATVTVSGTGYTNTLVTGHAFVSHVNWSGGQYASQSGGIDVNTVPGSMALLVNPSGTYYTGTNDWLISNTFDLGGSSSTLYRLSWMPSSQPPAAGPNSLRFQVAANNDNATWNFVGPDGTPATYFAASGTLPGALYGNRYVRYKAYLTTQDQNTTPVVNGVTLEFNADCVPSAQALFTAVPQGTYTVTVSAPNYADGSSTAAVGAGFQAVTVPLVHL